MAESKQYYDKLYRVVRDAISGKVTLHIADNVAKAVTEGLLKKGYFGSALRFRNGGLLYWYSL